MTTAPLRIATRASALALWQARHVAARLQQIDPSRAVQLVQITTSGDQNQTESLSQFGGVGVFTREVQRAVLDGRADLAVHSLKDLPTDIVPGLTLAAVPERAATHDAIVLPKLDAAPAASPAADPASADPNNADLLDQLPPNARIGTGSPRRRAQLLHLRPDLQLLEIRGNLDTRLRKLDEGQFDAIILAEAGLRRLDWADRISGSLGPPRMYPAVGQGALGIECRVDDETTKTALAHLSDAATFAAVLAERALLAELRAGCHAPLGVATAIVESRLQLEAVVLSLDGAQRLFVDVDGPANDPAAIGRNAANELRKQGADAIIRPTERP